MTQRLSSAQIEILKSAFSKKKYQDIAGLCKAATLEEVEAQGYSLNPGRYVGVTEQEKDDGEFFERFSVLNEDLKVLNIEARDLENKIEENVNDLLKG